LFKSNQLNWENMGIDSKESMKRYNERSFLALVGESPSRAYYYDSSTRDGIYGNFDMEDF
jgi:hypothetical protein